MRKDFRNFLYVNGTENNLEFTMEGRTSIVLASSDVGFLKRCLSMDSCISKNVAGSELQPATPCSLNAKDSRIVQPKSNVARKNMHYGYSSNTA
jgi:hypothetical protein